MIVIIGTGGTIAGSSASSTDLTGYKSGSLEIETLIAAVPALVAYGPFKTEQFSNIDSSDIMPEQWVELVASVNRWLAKDEVEGVVITHGTDSMEETAYFLHLTINSEKPVVMTGAMRPATSLCAEGSLNLLNAIQTAKNPKSRGKGVLVVLNNYIDNARDVRKTNTTNVDTFGNQVFGHMGIVQDGVPYFYNVSTRKHTINSAFCDVIAAPLKRVEILHLYAGISKDLVEAMLNLPLDGVVLAGLGHGTIPSQVREVLVGTDLPIVRASRTNSGMVTSIPTYKDANYLVSDTLTAEKARILLMLGLMKTNDPVQLQCYFDEY